MSRSYRITSQRGIVSYVLISILIFGPPSLDNNLGDESSSPISFL
jgi:hypothetical protein